MRRCNLAARQAVELVAAPAGGLAVLLRHMIVLAHMKAGVHRGGGRVQRTSRNDLITLLTEAAAVEHSLMCQYLFAALSLKQRTDEGLTEGQLTDVVGWERLVLSVARQEMEHLGLVINLLTAIGGAPQLAHPGFPYATHLFGGEMALVPFSAATVKKFVCFERPATVDPKDAYCEAPPAPSGVDYTTVGELYDRIEQALIAADQDPEPLFIGPPGAQVGGGVLGTDFPRVGAMGGGYDVYMSTVTDLATARQAIDRVIEQGEGNPGDHQYSHYHRFLQIVEELEQAGDGFTPARDVVPNPALETTAQPDSTIITHPVTAQVMGLFDDAYSTMLLVLNRLFAHTDETEDDLAVLRSVAFFPLMTMAVRPLAELLTEMPAFPDDRESKAGASFNPSGRIAFLPHREAAWTVLEEELRGLAQRADTVSRMPGVPARLTYIARSFDLIARRFAAGMGIEQTTC